MTDEETMKTSEITARLQHASTAVTRAWIRTREEPLEAVERDKDTGEKVYRRSDVEAAIESSTQRGPYRTRPTAQGPRDDDHGVPDSD